MVYEVRASAEKSTTCAFFLKTVRQKCAKKLNFFRRPERLRKKRMSNNNLTQDRDILGYIPARLTPNKHWYVEWYSFNPDEGQVTNISDFRANAKQYIDGVINDANAVVINRGNSAAVLISLDEFISKADQFICTDT